MPLLYSPPSFQLFHAKQCRKMYKKKKKVRFKFQDVKKMMHDSNYFLNAMYLCMCGCKLGRGQADEPVAMAHVQKGAADAEQREVFFSLLLCAKKVSYRQEALYGLDLLVTC